MKKLLLMFAICTFNAVNIYAQAPQGFKYQTIVRDNLGEPIRNQSIKVRFSILQTTISGTAVYIEVHKPNTNEFGLANLVIGEGAVEAGNFAAINWGADEYFIKVEVDPLGGVNYADMGTSQLISVPYAFYSNKAATAEDDFDRDATNELQNISLSGNTLSISNGNTITLPSGTIDTDDQTLSINGNQLTIQDGNTVTLPNGFSGSFNDLTNVPAGLADGDDTGTDSQTLSLSGSDLSISGGNTITLPSGTIDTDDQTLSLSGTTLSIADGNSVDLSSVNTDNQDLSLSGNTLSITNDATSVNLTPYLDNTDAQSLTFNSGTGELSISGGNTITLPTASGGDNWGSQTVVTNATLTGNGTSGSPLGVVGDLTDDQTLSLSSNTLSISGGNNVNLAPYLDNTDNQDLSLSGNTLSLTNDATPVDLSPFLDNTDAQSLSVSGNQLTITGGNTVTLSAGTTYTAGTGIGIAGSVISNTGDLSATNELQTISLATNTLTLSNSGGSVSLAPYLDNTDAQTLSLSGNTLSILGGNNVSLAAYLNTDAQTLSLSGNTLSISGGNSVALSITETDTFLWKKNVNGIHYNAGNVGINTSSPEERMHLYDGNMIIEGISSVKGLMGRYNGYNFNIAGSNGVDIVYGDQYNSFNYFNSFHYLSSNASTGHYIMNPSGSTSYPIAFFRNDGNIGFNTNAPEEKMHLIDGNFLIQSSSGLRGLMGLNIGSGNKFHIAGNDGSDLILGDNNNPANYDDFIIYASTATNKGVSITTSAGGTATPIAFFKNDGNAGINTNAPVNKLDVNGAIGIKFITSASTGTVNLDNSASIWMFTNTATIGLPTASTCTNRIYTIINRSGSSRTISTFISLTGVNTTTITNNTSIEIISNGSNWLQIR
jgi:hypothetical protein